MTPWLRTFLFITVHICICTAAPAQSPSFPFRNININEGLSQSSVVDIAVDKTGFLWFATQDGLNRYDGKEFLVFNKIFDDVTTPYGNRLGKIMTGNHNDLWLVTSGGKLEKLDLYDQSFTIIDRLSKDSIPVPPVSCLQMDRNNNLLIGTENNGLMILDARGTHLRHFTNYRESPVHIADNHIQFIFIDKKEQYWLLTRNGVSMLDNELKQVKDLLSRPGSFSQPFIRCSAMDEDSANNLWLGTFGNGLFVKKPGDADFLPFRGFNASQTVPADLIVETIKADATGRIWVGTYGKGLYLINPREQTVQYFLEDKRKPFSLDNNDVLCIKADTKGGLWIGTDGGGVSYYNNALNNFSTFSNINLPAGISIQQVRSIVTDKEDNIWTGTTNQGLVFIDPIKNSYRQLHYSYKPGTQERIVSLLADDEGDIWVGTQGNGLMIINAKTKERSKWFHPDTTARMKIPDHTAWCMLPFRGDTVLVGTQTAGLCFISKRTGWMQNALPQSIIPPLERNIRAMTRIDDSTICIGYERKGVQFLNTRSGQFKNISSSKTPGFWNGETVLKCIFYRAPYLLAGTLGKGLLIQDLSNNNSYHITEADGLPNNTVYGILEDQGSYLWLSSNKGLFRFAFPENPAFISRANFTVFNVEDGLQSNEFNTGAHYASSNGKLFFGGVKGLNFFNPAHFINTAQDIPVVITKATINNELFSGDTVIAYKKQLELDHKQDAISFTFAALDFLSNARLNYSYRLHGYDDNWINAGNRNYAAYTNLQPGNYVFEVRTFNPSTSKYGKITTLLIRIEPPYWQSWWFIAVCILVVAGLLYAFYRYRVNQLLQMQRVRSRIATDLHDDIGSTLTNINILSELSKKNLDKKQEAETFLNRITEEVNVTSQALDDIVWSINKDNDTIEQTIARMRRYAAEVFEGANIIYSLQSDESMEDRKLNMELRRDFFLLFKESINNIYKHSKAHNVAINVRLERNRLRILISDDGAGFDTNVPTHRNGIKNMYSRAAKWKGEIVIRSEIGEGTSTEISLPIT